jgi:hypothetical protein
MEGRDEKGKFSAKDIKIDIESDTVKYILLMGFIKKINQNPTILMDNSQVRYNECDGTVEFKIDIKYGHKTTPVDIQAQITQFNISNIKDWNNG